MKIVGTLAHFNFSPKGGYEDLIIITKKGMVQVNFEPDEACGDEEALRLAR